MIDHRAARLRVAAAHEPREPELQEASSLEREHDATPERPASGLLMFGQDGAGACTGDACEIPNRKG